MSLSHFANGYVYTYNMLQTPEYGPYHMDCGMQAELRAKELKKMNVGVRLVTVGKKGNLYFKRRADQYDIAGV